MKQVSPLCWRSTYPQATRSDWDRLEMFDWCLGYIHVQRAADLTKSLVSQIELVVYGNWRHSKQALFGLDTIYVAYVILITFL